MPRQRRAKLVRTKGKAQSPLSARRTDARPTPPRTAEGESTMVPVPALAAATAFTTAVYLAKTSLRTTSFTTTTASIERGAQPFLSSSRLTRTAVMGISAKHSGVTATRPPRRLTGTGYSQLIALGFPS